MTRIEALTAELTQLLADELKDRPVINSFTLLTGYLRARLVALKVEEVRVLFLNTKNHLISDEVHARGTINECPVHIRNVIHRALELGAGALILAHNHPSGDPTPSTADIRITQDLANAATPLGIVLHDHVIIAGAADPLSMRQKGYLQ